MLAGTAARQEKRARHDGGVARSTTDAKPANCYGDHGCDCDSVTLICIID